MFRGTTLLQNIVDSGIHIWKLKCIASKGTDVIGISKAMTLKDEIVFLDKDGEYSCAGYTFMSEGRIANLEDAYAYCGDAYGQEWGTGDSIEMKVE